MGKISDTESASLNFENMSSFGSTQGGGLGLANSYKADIKRVETINMNLLSVVNSKTPFEAIQAVLKTLKQAFKNVARLSVFIINKYL